MSPTKTGAERTASRGRPAASRRAPMFVNTCRVCSWTPPGTSWPVAGSSGICPERNSRPPALIACEEGPIAAGAEDVETASRTGRSGGLDDLAGPEAPRADAEALDAAVYDRAEPLQV